MKITTKEYIDKQFEWQERVRQADLKHMEARFTSILRETDKYAGTTDEWKTTHNNLQRQMQEQGKEFIKRGELWVLVLGVATFCLGIAMYLKH